MQPTRCVNPWTQHSEEREGYLVMLEDNGGAGQVRENEVHPRRKPVKLTAGSQPAGRGTSLKTTPPTKQNPEADHAQRRTNAVTGGRGL